MECGFGSASSGWTKFACGSILKYLTIRYKTGGQPPASSQLFTIIRQLRARIQDGSKELTSPSTDLRQLFILAVIFLLFVLALALAVVVILGFILVAVGIWRWMIVAIAGDNLPWRSI